MGRTAFEKRLHWLGEWFEHLHGVDPELIEEITLSSMPTRLFRRGAGVDADIVMENVVRALSKGLVDEHPKLPKLLERLHKSFEIVARGADKSGLAYNELLAVRKEWEALSRVVKSSKVEGAKDFAQWFDREADELAAIAGQRSRASGAVKAAPAAKAAPLAKAPKGKGKGPDGRQIYEAFEAAAENASLGASWSLSKLSWFVGADDPVWPRIAEAAAKLDARDAEAMALKIQGILGEALAVRHPWVAHSLTEAAEQ